MKYLPKFSMPKFLNWSAAWRSAMVTGIAALYTLLPYIFGLFFVTVYPDDSEPSKLYINGEFLIYSVGLLSALAVTNLERLSLRSFYQPIAIILLVIASGAYAIVSYTDEAPDAQALLKISIGIFGASLCFFLYHQYIQATSLEKVEYLITKFSGERNDDVENLTDELVNPLSK